MAAAAVTMTPGDGPFTLSIDVGGSGLKVAVLDADGKMMGDRVRVDTPQPATPDSVLGEIAGLIQPLPSFQRVSVGFPGVVRDGRILTAANLDEPSWRGYDLGGALAERLGKPVRILNDADVQGLGVIRGSGLEMVLTLGTGFGTALFLDGAPAPHLEFAHHPFRKGQTYEEQLGERARKKIGNKKWNRRLERAITTLRSLVNFDRIYLGGGNSRHVFFQADADTEIVSNTAGILGGIALWDERFKIHTTGGSTEPTPQTLDPRPRSPSHEVF
jgi:polyphosphate glucokinase